MKKRTQLKKLWKKPVTPPQKQCSVERNEYKQLHIKFKKLTYFRKAVHDTTNANSKKKANLTTSNDVGYISM